MKSVNLVDPLTPVLLIRQSPKIVPHQTAIANSKPMIIVSDDALANRAATVRLDSDLYILIKKGIVRNRSSDYLGSGGLAAL